MMRMRPSAPQKPSKETRGEINSPSNGLPTANDLSEASMPSAVDLTTSPMFHHTAESVAVKYAKGAYAIGAVSVRVEFLKGAL